MPAVNRDDERIVHMPEAEVTAASGMCQAIRDAFWIVDAEKGLLFWEATRRRRGQLRGAAPQCNREETIARAIMAKLYPWAEVRQVALVLVPIDLADYR